MEEKDNIADLPSYSKIRKDVQGANAIGKVVKFLSFFGIKNDGLNEAFSKIPNLKKEVEHLSTLPDRFNSHFASLGWISHESMNSPLMEKAVELADNNDISGAETILANHFTSTEISWLQHRFRVLPAFSIRFELIEKAYKDTLEKRFHSCVPLLLTIIDGAVNDISKSKGFFSENTELKAWDSIAAHSSGLTAIKDIFNASRKKTNSEDIFLPYRNGILHGRDLKFDNQLVVGKCWSTLFAVNDWARALKEEKENPPIPEKQLTFGESLRELKETIIEHQEWKVKSDLRWKELDNWKPRENINIEPSNFNEFSPEKTAFEIAESWKNKNYGNIAKLIHRFSNKEINIGKEAGKIRRELEYKKLISFKIKSVRDEAPAISEITMDIVYQLYDNEKSKEIVLRMICKADDGQMGMNGKENMSWEFIDNFFYSLDF
ncbi:hypothetical protein [Winogradskyella ludwigii]|uniref:hypothetical protein n=1 Tax=Winogradskyella ludwigii TaxID=2686076 RepID=UPI0015CCEC12|nr:hypothetical protein [Winogradskyella ludwigii]